MMVDGGNLSVLGPGDSAGEMAALCGNLTEDYQVELETKVHTKVRNHGEGTSRRFQPGEGPSRGFLRDYKPSDGPSFQALFSSKP